MAVLQISEPGQSPEPHRHRLAVGIDLGTTNSLVAAVRNGIAVVLNDHEGRALLPSIVRYLGDGGVAVCPAGGAADAARRGKRHRGAKTFSHGWWNADRHRWGNR